MKGIQSEDQDKPFRGEIFPPILGHLWRLSDSRDSKWPNACIPLVESSLQLSSWRILSFGQPKKIKGIRESFFEAYEFSSKSLEPSKTWNPKSSILEQFFKFKYSRLGSFPKERIPFPEISPNSAKLRELRVSEWPLNISNHSSEMLFLLSKDTS